MTHNINNTPMIFKQQLDLGDMMEPSPSSLSHQGTLDSAFGSNNDSDSCNPRSTQAAASNKAALRKFLSMLPGNLEWDDGMMEHLRKAAVELHHQRNGRANGPGPGPERKQSAERLLPAIPIKDESCFPTNQKGWRRFPSVHRLVSYSNWEGFLARVLLCVEEAGAPDFPTSARFFKNAAETVWKKAFDLVYDKIDEIPTEHNRYRNFESKILKIWITLEYMEKNNPCWELAMKQYCRYKLALEYMICSPNEIWTHPTQQRAASLPSLAFNGIATTTLHTNNTHQKLCTRQEFLLPSNINISNNNNCPTQYYVASLSSSLVATHRGQDIENYSQSSQRQSNGTEAAPAGVVVDANPNKTGQRLRKGAWTIQEVEYASRVIQFFGTGLLPLPDGATTVRSYLAKKLNRDPMSKFTCACWQVYILRDCPQASSYILRDRRLRTASPCSVIQETVRLELLQLEQRFRWSVAHQPTNGRPYESETTYEHDTRDRNSFFVSPMATARHNTQVVPRSSVNTAMDGTNRKAFYETVNNNTNNTRQINIDSTPNEGNNDNDKLVVKSRHAITDEATTKRKDPPPRTLPSVPNSAILPEGHPRKKKRTTNHQHHHPQETPFVVPCFQTGNASIHNDTIQRNNQTKKKKKKLAHTSSRAAIPLSPLRPKRNSTGSVVSSVAPLTALSRNINNGSKSEIYEYEIDWSDGGLVF